MEKDPSENSSSILPDEIPIAPVPGFQRALTSVLVNLRLNLSGMGTPNHSSKDEEASPMHFPETIRKLLRQEEPQLN